MQEVAFYRCASCNRVVSLWDIRRHYKCPACGQNKIRPSNLSLWEKIFQMWKHPKLWRWGDESYFRG